MYEPSFVVQGLGCVSCGHHNSWFELTHGFRTHPAKVEPAGSYTGESTQYGHSPTYHAENARDLRFTACDCQAHSRRKSGNRQTFDPGYSRFRWIPPSSRAARRAGRRHTCGSYWHGCWTVCGWRLKISQPRTSDPPVELRSRRGQPLALCRLEFGVAHSQIVVEPAQRESALRAGTATIERGMALRASESRQRHSA